MDIFNHKRIEELERELASVKYERDKALVDLYESEKAYKELGSLLESVPESYTRGPWCEACHFVKTFEVSRYVGMGRLSTITGYYCGKGESCRHFMQKENKNE